VRRALVFVVVVLVVAGCGAAPDDGATPRTASHTSGAAADATSTTEGAYVPTLVGEWSRTTTCQQRSDALEAAGLGRFAAEHAAGEDWIPGVTSVDQLEDPKHPCKGAVPLKHSHYFTPEGLFGSRNAEGEDVDDGTYELVGEDTVVVDKEFGKITFHYRIEDGDTLYLDPELPACAKKGCFDAQWAIAVSYPGLPWTRIGRLPGGPTTSPIVN
jgi:hypothetical protein